MAGEDKVSLKFPVTDVDGKCEISQQQRIEGFEDGCEPSRGARLTIASAKGSNPHWTLAPNQNVAVLTPTGSEVMPLEIEADATHAGMTGKIYIRLRKSSTRALNDRSAEVDSLLSSGGNRKCHMMIGLALKFDDKTKDCPEKMDVLFFHKKNLEPEAKMEFDVSKRAAGTCGLLPDVKLVKPEVRKWLKLSDRCSEYRVTVEDPIGKDMALRTAQKIMVHVADEAPRHFAVPLDLETVGGEKLGVVTFQTGGPWDTVQVIGDVLPQKYETVDENQI